MHLRRLDEHVVQLELTDSELGALQNGLNEALEALEDWEFFTRMGIDRTNAQRIRDDLREARRCLDEGR